MRGTNISNSKCNVRFRRRTKCGIHADVKLPRSNLKPTTPARSQRFRFFNFLEAENFSKELPRRSFASCGSSQLNVINVRE